MGLGRIFLQAEHGNAVVERTCNTGNDIARDRSANHSFQAQPRDLMPSGRSQGRNAPNLNRDRHEVQN